MSIEKAAATSPEAIVAEMRQRGRTYFRSIVLIIIGSFGGAGLVSAVGLAVADRRTGGLVAGVAMMVGCVAVMALSWRAVFKYLRCPACEGSVWMTFSWNVSLFSRMARATCPHCSAVLFDVNTRKQTVRMLLVIMGVFFMLGVLASAGMVSQKARAKPPASSSGQTTP